LQIALNTVLNFRTKLIEVHMLKPMAIVLMVALAAPAAGQNASPAQQIAPAVSKDKDPNRIICEREEEIGTRLGGKKVCKTAAQWQLERQQQRETIEGVQRQGTSVGSPSGGI
jgi:invasion protein IalB